MFGINIHKNNSDQSQPNGSDSSSVFFNSDNNFSGAAALPEKISYADAQVMEVEIEKIVPNPFQPRKNFNEQALRELADSIKEHGVIQPLVVNQTDKGYELVVGERRFRASQL